MSEIKVECQEDFEALKEIEEKVIKKVDLGFDPRILQMLDREDVSRSELESLRTGLSAGVVARLFGLANSVHYGRLRAGKMTDFPDVILRLGLGPSKIYILSLALFFLNFRRDFTELAARSFIISFLGKMLAMKMGLTEEEVKKAEIGGIFLKVGKVFMLLHEQRLGKKLDEAFVSQYYPFLGLRAVEIFGLPEFLNEIISFSQLRFDESAFSVSSIVDLAHSTVDKSFKKFGKFAIQSPMPDPEGILLSSPGSILAAQLDAVGLGAFLDIDPILTPRQQIQALRKASAANHR
jgi:hypothetical protein